MKNDLILLSPSQIDSLVYSECDDVFALLGLHEWGPGQFVLRAFLPGATRVEVIAAADEAPLAELSAIRDGIFAGLVAAESRFRYRLRVHFGDYVEVREDPYRFGTSIGEMDLYLFGEGRHEKLYDWLGAHVTELDGVRGVRFAVWAPNARRVSVVGEFNFWDGRHHMMRKHIPSGVWEIFIPSLDVGTLYKYEIKTRDGHLLPQKSDPFGFAAGRPHVVRDRLGGLAARVVVNRDARAAGPEGARRRRTAPRSTTSRAARVRCATSPRRCAPR